MGNFTISSQTGNVTIRDITEGNKIEDGGRDELLKKLSESQETIVATLTQQQQEEFTKLLESIKVSNEKLDIGKYVKERPLLQDIFKQLKWD